MYFKDVIGQKEVKSKLIQTVRDERISHGIMFAGEVGYGGLALSLAYAQFILCENKQENDSCGECPQCQKAAKLIHPDLHFVFPVTTTKSNTKPVSDDFIKEWREAVLDNPYMAPAKWYKWLGVENKQGMIYSHESNNIIKKLNLKTFEGEYKIMIIWQPERMNPSSANKLLKILEEPPQKTLFILVSLLPGQILPTLISRVQMIKIPPIDDESLYRKIGSGFDRSVGELRNISNISGGSFSRALEFLYSSEDRIANFEEFKSWMRLCFKKDVLAILDWVDKMAKTGREKEKSFLIYTLEMVRANFLLNQIPEHKNVMVKLAENEDAFSAKFSAFITEKNVFIFAEELEKAINDIGSNAYAKVILLDLSIKVMGLLKQ
ncbi:MAG: DNA polymerase III subunit delta [Bacteroidetes bacterium]|nr:MAG: DNA polymerase III subunit delta [Bacteroidota bacterium]